MKDKTLENFFDYASGTPIDPQIEKAMGKLKYAWVNPSAEYKMARISRQKYNEAIGLLAKTMSVNPAEIVITSGGSESNNLAILGLDSQYEILVSKVEHQSIIQAVDTERLKFVDVHPDGIVDVEDLKSKINDNVGLISVMMVNNEIGTIQPLKQIAQLVQEIRKDRQKRSINTPIYLHTDACQAPNYLNIQPKNLGVDMMSINSGKIYGPKGVGLLFVSSSVKGLSPIIRGGGQQRGLRSGTEDTAGAFGFALALEKAQNNRDKESKRVSELRDELAKLLTQSFPSAVVNGSTKQRVANNLNVSFVGYDNETLMISLDELGLSVATGSACSANSNEPSYVLEAIGASKEQISGSIRISLGRYTNQNSIKALKSGFDKILA